MPFGLLFTFYAARETPIKIRQLKYLNNIVEQDRRAIKRRTRLMLGFKTFRCARILLGGIEVMHIIMKGQMINGAVPKRSVAEQFYFLATQVILFIMPRFFWIPL